MVAKIALIIGAVGLFGTIFALVKQQQRLDELVALAGKPLPSVASGTSAAPTTLLVRIQRLESRVSQLDQEVRIAAALGDRNGAASQPSAEGKEQRDKAVGRAADSRTAVLDTLESSDPQIRDRLKTVVREEQERLLEERREVRDERLADRTRERISALAARLSLSDAKVDLVSDALDAERAKISELFRQASEDFDLPHARLEAKRIRDATDAQMKASLGDDEFAAYMEMRAEDRARFGPLPANATTQK